MALLARAGRRCAKLLLVPVSEKGIAYPVFQCPHCGTVGTAPLAAILTAIQINTAASAPSIGTGQSVQGASGVGPHQFDRIHGPTEK